MLVFNEGVPGSGKSYDVVKHHIVPALKKGRPVFARLNGIDEPDKRDAMAAHLGITREALDALFVHVPTSDVHATFVAEQGEDGKWHLPARFKNALVIIDEVHEFYVGGTREALPPEREQFFAMHRHMGVDIVVMSQFYKRVHTAIRHRVEVKNAFQKLSALGKLGESRYTVRRFQTIMPDRYEQVGIETHSYDPAMFPLYRGVAADDVQTEVYKGGRTTVWKSMALRAAIIVPLGIAAVWYLISFFAGGGASLVKTTKPQAAQPVAVAAPGVVFQREVDPPTPAEAVAAARAKRSEALTPEQRYVWDMTEKARIRFTGAAQIGERVWGWVEWYDSSSVVQDRLELAQVRALGVSVTVHPYGLRLEAGGEAIIATAWPLNLPAREPAARLYDTSGGDVGRASNASPSDGSPQALTARAHVSAGQLGTAQSGGAVIGAPAALVQPQGDVWADRNAVSAGAGDFEMR